MGHPEDAAAAFTRTLRLDPTYPGAHLHLGRIHLSRQERDKARRHLRNEHLLMPEDPRILLDLSNLLVDAGETRVAIACLKRLTQIQPRNPSAWQNLAVAFFLRGRYDDGIAASHQALQREPAHLMAMHNLAIAYERMRQYDDALRWVRSALSIDPKDATFQRLELRLRVLKLRSRAMGALRSIFGLRRSAAKPPRP
jgi:tetratricopeptide (TPR) repeat protein